MTANEYLYDTDETTRRRELHHGIVREPPAPFFSHQQTVLRVARVLCGHVEPRRLGRVAVAPVDVILDADRALVVQPDVLFVSEARAGIIRNQVWGAPDLVVEVLSVGTAAHDRGEKLDWYGHYGVRECWLIDSWNETLVVVDFTVTPREERVFRTADAIRSSVLPGLEASPSSLFCG